MQQQLNWSQQKRAGYFRLLLDAGLLESHQDSLKASRRWQAAMARSALSLLESKTELQDERLAALLSLRNTLNPIPDDDALCDLVFLMCLIERTPVNYLAKEFNERSF